MSRSSLFVRSAWLHFFAAAIVTFASTRSDAQTNLFWDANGAATGTGGTGNWLTTNTWRSGSSAGTLGDWSDGNRAMFGGTAGTVTLNGAVSATGVTFQISGYTITGANTLTLTSTSTSSGAQAIETTNASGTNTIESNIILGASAGSNQRFSITSGGTLVVSGNISETNAGIILSKSGGGTLTLTGNNSYTGGTLLTAGVIAVGSDTALGSGPLTFSDGTTLQSADTNTRTLANVWSPPSGSSNTIFGSATTGDLILTDATSFSLGTTVKTITVNNTTTTLSKVFTGTSAGNGLAKAGAGTLVLKGASTYNGTTTVNAGTLLANNTTGSATGTSSVSVNNGGTTLGGTGTIGGPVTVNSGAIILGGTGASASGTLTIANNLTLNSGSIIELALGPSFTHSTLARTGGTWSFQSNQQFTFIDLGATTGTYQNIITGLASDPGTGSWTITNPGWTGTFVFDGANIDLILTAVPEPGTWFGAALTMSILLYTQRRRIARRCSRDR